MADELITDDRKREDYTVLDEGRDKGKVFRVTEMSAWDAEDWAGRVAYALFVKHGVQLPEGSGMAGLASIGAQPIVSSGVPELRQLVKELMSCVQIVPDPKKNPKFSRPVEKADVSEIVTLLKLKVKVIEMHLGFSIAEFHQKWTSAMKSPESSSDTPDSAPPSAS